LNSSNIFRLLEPPLQRE